MPDTFTCLHSKSRVVVQEKISRLNFLQMPSKLAQICLSSVVNCWFECVGVLLNRSFFCLRIVYFFHVLLDWDKSKTFSSSLLSNRLAQRCSEVYISYSLLTISSNRYWLTTCGNNGSVISSQPVSEIMLRRLLRVYFHARISWKAIHNLAHWDCSDWVHSAVAFCTGTFKPHSKS